MGILRLHETENADIDEFHCVLLSCVAGHRRKDGDDLRDRDHVISGAGKNDVLEKLVCVTSGVLYLGIVVVNKLLVHGYSVRIIVDNEELETISRLSVSPRKQHSKFALLIQAASMGILRLHETENADIDEFHCVLLSCVAGHRRKDGDDLRDRDHVISGAGKNDVLEKLVCVTSGVLYLGIVVVNKLLVYGYSVRIIVDNEGLFCITSRLIFLPVVPSF
ncbi:unnamed protein product [Fraxinus pennsylvanica]|uniref:Uncharacterized protein n=1 Tax=Fraxinus pennsylvanica TaxID=56036 RepID=A0AAD1ZC57_9LAMI|nr:unnamed protein product [Fraxinus pennsylvanica]